MKFLVDAQLPLALARAIRATGHECEHVADAGLLGADDQPIWKYATAQNSVVVTKDEDFSILRAVKTSGPPVVWLRLGNCSNHALLTWFMPLFADIVARLEQGEGLIEVV